MIKKLTLLVVLVSLVALSCSTLQNFLSDSPTQASSEEPLTETDTLQVPPSETLLPSETLAADTATQTHSETLAPTEEISQEDFLTTLLEVVDSEYWPFSGMSEERRAAWEAIAQSLEQPSDEELEVVEFFIEQWAILYDLVQAGPIPAGNEIGLFVEERLVEEGGADALNLYAADPTSLQGESPPRFYLIARDNEEEAVALVIAPEIQGFSQRLSPDGYFIEYVDEDGDPVLEADARQLEDSPQHQRLLKEYLNENSPEIYYSENSTYPRFHINNPGVGSSFYLIEKLTYNQILLLISTFQLFDRPELADMKQDIFPAGDDVDFLISREPHPFAAALALPLGGTPREGVVVLFSRNIFDNRYDTASSIAHEATHIWQGKSPDCDFPELRLEREVGDQTIPSGFYEWTAAELVKAAKEGEIGSYHVSLWVLTKFGQTTHADWIKDVIRTGRANGSPIINCEP